MVEKLNYEKLDFWKARRFGHWDLSQFDQTTYEGVVAAIIRISQVTNEYPIEASASSAMWFIGGLMIEIDWTGGVVTISTGWPVDHQRTPHEQQVYRGVSRLLGEIGAMPLQYDRAVQ